MHRWNTGKPSRGVTRQDVPRALTDGIKACSACRPDTEVGFLDS
ncbi:DUF6233 domain-containing protein [Streptomyces sp. HMX87]